MAIKVRTEDRYQETNLTFNFITMSKYDLTDEQAIKLGFLPEPKPEAREPLKIMNFEIVKELAVNHMKSRESGEYHCDNDDATYVFEAVMEAVYGDDVFKYLNKLSD